MHIRFNTDLPIEETMEFERLYEPELQLSVEDKLPLIADGIAVWMFVDDVLAGEIYGAAPHSVNDDLPDAPRDDPALIYCYSTSILPQFQNRKLGKILVAYWNGLARGRGFTRACGHATDPRMVSLREFFGARFLAKHQRWYGTKRTAHYYECDL